MKVIKPNSLSVITRCFEHRRRHHFAVSVLAFVPLTEDGAGPLLSEVSLWKTVAERLGPAGVLEPGIPKLRGEMLVQGSAYAPGGVPRPSLPVVARVGELQKAIMVHGDRYWTVRREPSEAQPFVQMPLDWSRAYGGPRYPRNPLGRGHGESEYMGQRVQMLPNLERPDEQVAAPRDRPEPVTLGPLDISWPQRRELAGTYDRTWTETRFPGLADDVDWRLFNLAAPDQQIDGAWQGGESYRLDNLHPRRPVMQGRLPDYAARAFVTRARTGKAPPPDELGLEEIELSLRTLWLLPDLERAVLVFQGATEVTDPEGADIGHLVLAAERREQPRPPEHYARALQDRLDPERGHLAALRQQDLMPTGEAEHVDEDQARERALHESERRLEHNLHRRALEEHDRTVAGLKEAGLDPEQYGPPPPQPPAPAPPLEELPGMVEQLQEQAQQRQEQEQASAAQRRTRLREQMLAQGIPAPQADELLAASERGPTGPPRFTAQGQRAALRGRLEQARSLGGPTDGIEEALEDPEQYERWQRAEQQLRDNYRQTAHLQDPAPALTPARSEDARLCLREALEAGTDLGTLDLSGADLSGMSLRGAAMAGAFLESARLDGADLRGADLRGAVLAHASLAGARLDEADLREANLGYADLTETCLREANLEQAVLMGTRAPRAVLRGARLVGAELFRIVLTDADATEIVTEQLRLLEAEVTGLNLAAADLRGAVFLELDLSGAQMLGARLDGATFVTCRAPAVSFAGATLDNARFVKDCELPRVSFAGASLRGCNLRETALGGASFDEASLEGADLSGCDLRGASLHRASARGARFDGADLEDASLVAANLMQASLLGATIRGVDLRGANLYGADMARVRTDERVRLEQANLARVRVLPRHEDRPS
ncbi:MAG: DUF2169 domain-containing protein [Nannocystaceae bacterium]